MKKLLFVAFIFITGCSNYTDLKDLTIIKSIGIEYKENYTIYAQIYDEIKKDNDPKIKVITINGNNITDSFNNLKKAVNKKIFLSHIDLLILDTNLDKSNYEEIINYFIYNNELRNDFLTILSDDIKSLLNNTDYNEIEDYIKTNKSICNIINISFEELANNYLENNYSMITKINYNNHFIYENYFFYNHKMERVTNEKNRT